MACIAGYVLAIDATERDEQTAAKNKGMPWSVAKGYDSFLPLSTPFTLEADEEWWMLRMWLDVNGEAIWNTTGYPFGITHGCTDSPAAAVVGESAPAPYTVVAAAKSAAQPPIHAMVGVSVADACVARLPSRVGMSSRIRAQ